MSDRVICEPDAHADIAREDYHVIRDWMRDANAEEEEWQPTEDEADEMRATGLDTYMVDYEENADVAGWPFDWERDYPRIRAEYGQAFMDEWRKSSK